MSATDEAIDLGEVLSEIRQLRRDLKLSLMREPLSEEDLAARWRVSTRQVKRICKRYALQPMNMGHCTKRFRPADVDRAEERMAGGRTRR